MAYVLSPVRNAPAIGKWNADPFEMLASSAARAHGCPFCGERPVDTVSIDTGTPGVTYLTMCRSRCFGSRWSGPKSPSWDNLQQQWDSDVDKYVADRPTSAPSTGRLGPGKPITTKKTNAVEVFADNRLTALDRREVELAERERHLLRKEEELDDRWAAYRDAETEWIDAEVTRRIAPFKQALSDTFDVELIAATEKAVDERLRAANQIRRTHKRRRIAVCKCGQVHQPKRETTDE